MPALPPVITSRTNARVKGLRASLSGDARRPGDLLGLEGEHLVREAHRHGLSLEAVFLREGNESFFERVGWAGTLKTKQWFVLSRDVFDSAVSTVTPQGIAAMWIIREPEAEKGEFRAGLLLEGLQDPGNLGTLIRSAAAFGAMDIVVTPDSVNTWSPKVVRSAAGAMFITRVRQMTLESAVQDLRRQDVRIFAAVSSFQSSPERGVPLMAAPLGVLTGRQLNKNAPADMRYKEQPWGIDAGDGAGYPASFSYDTDFLDPHAILIGNEGAGLSAEARRLADEEVMIPCGVESLNAAVAGSILLYESMRQVTLRSWARQRGLRP